MLVAGLALSACGYRPLYGQNTSAPAAQQHLESVNVKPIPDRVGQMMRTALTRRLSPRGAKSSHAYDVVITLDESVTTLAVERNAFATRANLTLSANYLLTRRADHATLTSGSVKSVASYNILASDFATKAAKDDSRNRAIQDVADTLRTRLAIYFQGPGQNQPPLKSGTVRP
ncbi:LPS assembly lipoprotein LptE [Magnetovibrio sp.]|uniref:LPS assembly lipoprotein LptE n=1 Tax=Magnetovibrio sp. TaxID=2024836 RepID=UPI002F927EE7